MMDRYTAAMQAEEGALGAFQVFDPVKYEEVYLKAYSGGREAKAGIDAYFRFYNTQRPHQALGYRTPAEVLNDNREESTQQTEERRWPSDRELDSDPGAMGLSLNFAPSLSN